MTGKIELREEKSMKFRQYRILAATVFLCGGLLISGSVPLAAAQNMAELPVTTMGDTEADKPSVQTRESASFCPEEESSPEMIPEGTSLRMDVAGTNQVVVKVTGKDIAERGAYHAVQEALDLARANATEAAPYRVEIEPGSYTLEYGLHIYSNTYLYMQGVTFHLSKGSSANMLKVGDIEDTQTGYYYKNITLEGGVWNENGNGNTCLKAAHVSGFAMLNQTLMNVKDGHLVELAGAENVTIKGCTFKDQTLKSGAKSQTFEAVQIDILQKEHFTGYRLEELPIRNIVFEGCTFTNVPRGIGSHTAVLNSQVDNVKITGCTFSKIKSAAIQSMNWKNCEISGNVIKDGPRGIAIYSIRDGGTFLASEIAKEGGIPSGTKNSYVEPAGDQNIVIRDNTITCSGKDPYLDYGNSGISVMGIHFKKATKQGDGSGTIPAGNYFVSGAVVSGNKISTDGFGIRLMDTKNSTVENNQIRFVKSSYSKDMLHGIHLFAESTGNRIDGNVITKTGSNGSGILLSEGSSATSVSRNRIVSPKGFGISVDNASADIVNRNKITSPAYHGIIVYQKGTAGVIGENVITSGKQSGIVIASLKQNLEISANKISKCKENLVYVNADTQKYTVNLAKNTLTGNAGIYGIFVNSGRADITENTVSSTKIPVLINTGVKAVTGGNVFKKNKTNSVAVGFQQYKSLPKPKNVKAAKSGKNAARVSWQKVSGAAGYIVYRSTSKDGVYSVCGTVSGASKTSYTDRKLKTGKTYYYKVAAFKRSSDKKVQAGGAVSAAITCRL